MDNLLEWLDQIDRSILYFINDTLSNPIFDLFFTTITNEHLWAIPALIGLVTLIVRGGKRGKIAAGLLLITAIATDKTVVEIIKPAIGRLRPSHALADTVNLLVPKGGRYGLYLLTQQTYSQERRSYLISMNNGKSPYYFWLFQ